MEIDSVVGECKLQKLPISYMVRNDSEESNLYVFEKGHLYADIEIYDSGIVLAVTSDKDNRPDVWTVDDLTETIGRIKSFFDL